MANHGFGGVLDDLRHHTFPFCVHVANPLHVKSASQLSAHTSSRPDVKAFPCESSGTRPVATCVNPEYLPVCELGNGYENPAITSDEQQHITAKATNAI